ncbi:MAG: hypothetical protein K6G55_00780 [Selenomonadaceae bacterium]|nr:hypothetical protein [Selenomonadaceae bacterium]
MNYRALAATTIVVLIGGGLYFYGSPEKPPESVTEKTPEKILPKEAQGVGIIDIDRVYAAHPDGTYLNELRAKELRLRLELNALMRVVEIPKPVAPKPEPEIFDAVAWQKNAQEVIGKLAELENREKLAMSEYKKNSEPEYIERRNKIRDEFMNEHMNIQLKLTNADNLHLKQEEVNELLARLDELEMQRNAKQKELLDTWLAEIEKYASDSVAEEKAKLKAEYEHLRQVMEAESAKRQTDVTERNRKLMEDAMREMQERQVRRQEMFAELREVGEERAALEKQILNSISDKAMMLASVHRLEMIVTKRRPDIEMSLRTLEWNFDLKEPPRVGAMIFAGKDSIDLTDELIKEMNRLQ